MLDIVTEKFSDLKAEPLSVGKYKNKPFLNEDGWVITRDTFAVIDGSAPRVDLKFDGKSSARFATDVVKSVLSTTGAGVNGKELVVAINTELNKEMNRAGIRNIIKKTKEACPAALFTAARIIKDKVIITALGDVSCRVNGRIIHKEVFKSEELMIVKRIRAMRRSRKQNPSISNEELLKIGRQTIKEDLKEQVRSYFNDSDNELGLGIINGENVPDKFIKTYIFDLKDIQTIEIFSDGYFILPASPEIKAWEKAFFAGEKEDSLRWNKYPAVKAADENMFSDDRTIVIVKTIVEE